MLHILSYFSGSFKFSEKYLILWKLEIHAVIFNITYFLRSKHLGTPAIYGSSKKCHQNCRRLQFYPHKKLWIKTANGCSSVVSHSKLQTVAVLWMLLGAPRGYVNKTADLCSSMDTFGPREKWVVNKTANGCSSMDTFGGSECA